jgi:AhpD family alkylhydroperoxidase
METTLTKAQEELVAIGAAIAANCEPCLAHHVRLAREAGLTDLDLQAAVVVARRVKETPARLILQAAHRLVSTGDRSSTEPSTAPSTSGCCG